MSDDDSATPAFDMFQHLLDVTDMPGATAGPPTPGDPRLRVLEQIRHDRTPTPTHDGEHVRTLAAMGFDIETVADALDRDVDAVEALAVEERDRIQAALAQLRERRSEQ